MFKCDFCGKAVAPRVKPILIVLASDVRKVSYLNEVPVVEDENDNKFAARKPKTIMKASSGSEFVAEFKSCAECQGIDVKPTSKVDDSILLALIKGMHAYAKKSNKKLEDDFVMQRHVEVFKTIPLNVLSKGLEDIKTAAPKWKLAYTAMENVVYRSNDADRGGRRAKADFIAGFTLLKAYETRGGSL